MRWNKSRLFRYAGLLIAATLLLLENSCKKFDTVSLNQVTSEPEVQSFYRSHPANSQVQRVIEEFRKRDLSTKLSALFLTKYGQPLWEKGFVVGPQPEQNARGADNSLDTVVIIPVLQPGISEVQTYIEARLSDSVQLDVHTGNDYKTLRFSNADTLTNEAEKLAIRFMLLNKDIFNYESFAVSDERLFHKSSDYSDTANSKREVFLKSSQSNARLITVCVDIITTTTTYHCTGTGPCMSGICDKCYLCVSSSSSTNSTCQSWWDDHGGGGTGSDGPTSGGGGGSGDGTGGGGLGPCTGSVPIGKALPCGNPGDDGWDPILIDHDPPVDPCDQVKGLINKPENAEYLQKVAALATAQNLTLNYEKTVSLVEGTPPVVTEGSGTTNNASAQLPDVPGQMYLSFSHTHPNISTGTYSVFSFGDLRRMSMLLHNGQLEAGRFVAFLSTYKGTYYALTISDAAKFADFFYHFNNKAEASRGNIMKWLESQRKAQSIQDKYFNNADNPLIKETDNDNNNVLAMFLDFMKDADLGVTLLETNAQFNDFTKVERQPNGTINRSPCN